MSWPGAGAADAELVTISRILGGLRRRSTHTPFLPPVTGTQAGRHYAAGITSIKLRTKGSVGPNVIMLLRIAFPCREDLQSGYSIDVIRFLSCQLSWRTTDSGHESSIKSIQYGEKCKPLRNFYGTLRGSKEFCALNSQLRAKVPFYSSLGLLH